MSSLDAARHQAVQPSTWVEPLRAAQNIREGLGRLPGITLLGSSKGALPTLHAYGFLCVIY